MKKIIKILFILLLILILYILAGMIVPPLFQKTTEKNNRIEYCEKKGAPERVLSIDNNEDALVWRLKLIENAKKKIVLATFDFRDDNSGKDIMSALFNAADRGVQVQILVDGMNGMLWSRSDGFKELCAHKSIEVKMYNPINIFVPWKLNYRMHDKYLIADDFAYILGGRNTDDLFLGNYRKSYNEDRDILVYETESGKGNSFIQLQKYFEEIWNLSCCKSYERKDEKGDTLREHYKEVVQKYGKKLGEPNWKKETIEANSIELCTNEIEPKNKEPRLWDVMIQEMKQSDDILIQTPYIICNEKMYQDLKSIGFDKKNGDMMINAVESGTNPFGCTDYLNEKKNIQKTGLNTYEYLGNQALHTKTILVSDNISFVGSCNLDMRSVYIDTEMMLRIDSPELNKAIREQVEALKYKSRHVLPNGNVVKGKDYRPKEQSKKEKTFQNILRKLIIPMRHLL